MILCDLEPPEAMVAILQTIDGGEVNTAPVAHLGREPIFLYPEPKVGDGVTNRRPRAGARTVRTGS